MNTRIAAVGLVILALAVGGFTYFYFHARLLGPTPQAVVPVTPPAVPSTQPTPVAPGAPQSSIYVVAENGGDENNLAPEKVTNVNPASPARGVLEALIQSPKSPLPAGTRLLDIRLNNGLATVNFSREFQKDFHGGDMQEAQAVNSILMTLGQFSTINQVQILVEGAPIDSLGGHFEISSPIPVLRPTSVQQAKSDTGTTPP